MGGRKLKTKSKAEGSQNNKKTMDFEAQRSSSSSSSKLSDGQAVAKIKSRDKFFGGDRVNFLLNLKT